jgi:hypothetical protein
MYIYRFLLSFAACASDGHKEEEEEEEEEKRGQRGAARRQARPCMTRSCSAVRVVMQRRQQKLALRSATSAASHSRHHARALCFLFAVCHSQVAADGHTYEREEITRWIRKAQQSGSEIRVRLSLCVQT